MIDFLTEFTKRGFFAQATNLEATTNQLAKEATAGYIGFDCTAKSLHVGNLLQIMILRLLQKHGHKPIVVIGGGTTKVGDPSGKDEARKLLTDSDINENMQGIKYCLEKFITFGQNSSDAIIVNNDEWLSSINYLDFLRDVGKHFSVNRMLSFESVKLRLEREQNLSFLEFNYMILQAYDFVELYKRYNCRIQFGGSDQWGNIVNGIELARKLNCKDELFGITTPLITTSSGAKMGKTASGAVWLNEELRSPYEYFQFWRNTEDADVIKFLKLFTDLDLEEISKLEKLQGSEINEAKKILAYEATKLCHGKDNADLALKTSIETFEKAQGSLEGLPEIILPKSVLAEGINLVEVLVETKLSSSKSEARKLIRGGGARIDDVAINDEGYIISLNNYSSEAKVKISSGKKNHCLVKFQ